MSTIKKPLLKSKSQQAAQHLSPITKYTWIGCITLFGIIPSLTFFDFVLHNAQYNNLLPLISLSSSNIVRAIFNTILFGAFGFGHSYFAQTYAQSILKSYFPSQTIRGVYIMITGLSLSVLMAFWQPIHPGDIWTPFFEPESTQKVAVLLFYGFMSGCLFHIYEYFNLGGFVGFNQLTTIEVKRTQGTPKLITTGLYGHTRHPIYLLTFCAFVISPTVLNWNRILFVVFMAIYLFFAIPIEERKATEIFGNAYNEYKQKVPTIIPHF